MHKLGWPRERAARLLFASLAVALVGCSDPATESAETTASSDTTVRAESPTTMPGAGLPDAIRCHTQYRPDASSLAGAEEPVLVVARRDELTPEPVRHVFPTMTLEITYAGEAPEGRNVTLRVLTETGDVVLTSLFQVESGDELRTDFAGGHGFTGLNYVHHGDANLQIWCRAL